MKSSFFFILTGLAWSASGFGAEDNGPAPAGTGQKAASFEPERRPLRVEDWPDWEAPVNRDRVFDFYAKQARHFAGRKPMPQLLAEYPGLDGGKLGHWGNQSEETWRDARWGQSDLGNLLATVIKAEGLTLPKAVCVRLGEDGELATAFDPLTLAFPLVWRGGFLQISDVRHGFMGGVSWQGVAVPQQREAAPTGPFVYHGFYRHGKRVIFVYQRDGTEMLDVMWSRDGQPERQRGPKAGHALEALTKGGPAQWPQWLETHGRLGQGAPFAVDSIALPETNPYGTLFFLSGHDFMADGTGVVATMTGEVWLVKGLDATLGKVRWKRFATGLHQPLGVRVKEGRIYVLGRDQITCLHDLNGDDEADFYECVTNAQGTSAAGHDYITGLEIDAEGRFYFASGNEGVCRVKPGGPVEVLATGFRNPNGLGLAEDGTVTTSVQEGEWMPASAVCQVVAGAHFGAGGPKNGQAPELPLLYLPRGEDNSSGGQVFLGGSAWESLRGQGNLVHFSPGAAAAFLVTRQNVKGRWQGAATRIVGGFKSGVQAGRFHPLDGHLYVSGMKGWGCYAPDDGCFQRLRYTGGETPVPVGVEARDNGILLRFNHGIDASLAKDSTRHLAQCWNYRYSAAYGSPEYSVRQPDTAGHDVLDIRSLQVLDGGKTLFVEMPQLTPANVVHLHLEAGAERPLDVFVTAHALGDPFTEFPGYEKIAKETPAGGAASPMALELSAPTKPNPWTKGEPGREVVVEAALGLQFVQKTLRAKAGEKLTLVFKNPDVVPHNWVLVKPGALHPVGNAVNLLIADPTGLARHYVPDSDQVLVFTDMVNPAGEFRIHFKAPEEKGDYPYLCSFPGHWLAMNGVLKVE